MVGKLMRNVSGKKGIGMSAPGRPKLGGGNTMGIAPPTGMPKSQQTTPTMFSSAGKLPKAKVPGMKAKLGMKGK